MGASIAIFSPLIVTSNSLQHLAKLQELRKRDGLLDLNEEERRQWIAELQVIIECIEAGAKNKDLNLGVGLPEIDFDNPEGCMEFCKNLQPQYSRVPPTFPTHLPQEEQEVEAGKQLYNSAKQMNLLQVNFFLPLFKIMQFFLGGTITKEQIENFLDWKPTAVSSSISSLEISPLEKI